MAVTLTSSWTLVTEVIESPSDLSGSIFNRVYAKVANQSITANTTTIDYEWRVGILYKSSVGVYSNYNRAHSFTATGNTTENYSGTWTFGGRYYTKGAETVRASFSITVQHDDNGQYSKTQTMTFGGWNNATKTDSETVTLPTIPRYSTLAVSNFTMGNSVTASVTQQASAFSSIVYYRYPNISSSWSELGRGRSATSLSISGTPTNVSSSIPSSNSTSAEFKVRTYQSSDYTGSYLETTPTVTVTASVPNYSPSCTVTSATEGNTAVSTAFPSLGGFVIGQSKLTVNGAFTGSYGSTPVSYNFTYNGSTKTVASTSTSASTTFDSVVSGQTTVSLQVTDSRGKTSSSATRTITLYSYSAPTVSITVTRGNLSGSTFTADPFGTAVQVKATWSASSVNSQNSVQSIVVKVGSTTKITYTPSTLTGTNVVIGTSTGYSTGSAYTFNATITDKLSSGTGSATSAKPTQTASTISAGNYNLGSSVTVSITQQSANFSSRVYYRYPSISSSWNDLGRATGSKTLTVTGTPSNVATSIPSSNSITAEILVRTYQTNNYTGSYLDTTTSVTASVPASYKPTASLTVEEGVSAVSTAFPNLGGFVIGYSKIRGTGGFTGSYGSTAVSYAFSYNGVTKTVSSTATSVTATSNNYVASGATTVSLTVTDSRGRTGTASQTITLYTYTPPTLQIALARGTVSGSTFTPDVFGTAVRVQAKWSVSSVNSQNSAQSIVVNDGTANRITYTPSALTADWTTIGTISSVTYDAGEQYTFTATLTDKLTTASATAILATSKMPISLYDDNGTVGVAVGQMASDDEANKFNVYLPTTLKSTATFTQTATFSGTSTFNNDATFNDVADFNGATTFDSTVDMNGTTSLDGATTVNGTATINSTSTFNNTATFKKAIVTDYQVKNSGGWSKEVYCDVSASDIATKNGGTAPTDMPTYMKVLLMCICDKYPSYENNLFKGRNTLGSNLWYEVFIYNTSNKATASGVAGLPVYSFGWMFNYNMGYNFVSFGTRTSSGTTTYYFQPQYGWNGGTTAHLKNWIWYIGSDSGANAVALYVGSNSSSHTNGSRIYLQNASKIGVLNLDSDGTFGLYDNNYGAWSIFHRPDGMKILDVTRATRFTDANDILPSGMGRITMGQASDSSQANFPEASPYYTVIAISNHNGNHVKQFALRAGTLNEVWMRSRYTNSDGVAWGAWVKLPTVSDVTTSAVSTTSNTTFYPSGGTATSGRITQYASSTFAVENRPTNSTPYTLVSIGSTTTRGYLRLWDNASGNYAQFYPASGLTGSRTLTMPNASGTLALTSQLPSRTTATGVITKTSGVATCESSTAVKYGNTVTIYATFKSTSGIGWSSSGTNGFVGSLSSTYRPTTGAVSVISYYGGYALGLRIQTDGTVHLRNCNGSNVTITPSNGIDFSLTYVI